MSYQRCIFPKVQNDRSWTKTKWKAVDGYTRKISRLIWAKIDHQALENAYMDLMVYGRCTYRIGEETITAEWRNLDGRH